MNDNDFDDVFEERKKLADKLGWKEVHAVYDDMYGGIYLGGIDPEDDKWKAFPNSTEEATE